ncbi:hypothetical protein NDU88_005470 [Pleurodeles waltl]|uniref:Uncharacterized protein n=1 Tax=Pleurodeles waltl TaxID=8319 RepID=A0AAV7MCY5_PLEWA|nr:hypothetical protein NDU88_005470 [Pleurodeles waltl]
MGCRGAPTKNFSVCCADTEIRDGCNCTRRTFPLRQLHSEPASSWEGVSRWAGGRPPGGRPPAQRETQNNRSGLLTAVRYSGGGNSGGRPPPPARVRMTPIMPGADENVVELDLTPYLHLMMMELRSLCKIKKIPIGLRPSKQQLQELLAEFEKANPSEDDNPENEDSELEENSHLLVLTREPRDPQSLIPTVLVRDAAFLTGGASTSEITEDSLSEDDLLLARMAKRLALERQLLAIERERQEKGLGPINGGSNLNRVRDSPDMLKIPKGIVTKYEDGDDITKWFTSFERACATRKVNKSHWGALLWEMFTGKCRDRLLTLSGKDAESYDLMKATLI